MRPADKNVTFSLYQLQCTATEDVGGDEPYIWILGFKVDRDTLGPPPPLSAIPTPGVEVFEGAPASPFLMSPNQSLGAPATIPIAPALGTRSFTLRPALIPGGWFDGIAGVICLLFEQDRFSRDTSHAAYLRFKEVFGPALSAELTKLLNDGVYDDALSRDVNGNVVSVPSGLTWRLARLRDAGGRKNAVAAIRKNVRDQINAQVTEAVLQHVTEKQAWYQLTDEDDKLGAEVQVYLGNELGTSVQDFNLGFTDDEANYLLKGHVSASLANITKLESAVTSVERKVDGLVDLWLRVCHFAPRIYWALSYRLNTTTRFELRNTVGIPPSSVRWFLDNQPLADGDGTITVHFEPINDYVGPPEDALATKYQGGYSQLRYRTSGTILDIWNEAGDGVYFGKVKALYAYPGDPSLFPTPTLPVDQLFQRGYEREADLTIFGVELVMGDDYNTDVQSCKRILKQIDRKRIPQYVGKPKINPGDPPPYREELLERVAIQGDLAAAFELEVNVQPIAPTPHR